MHVCGSSNKLSIIVMVVQDLACECKPMAMAKKGIPCQECGVGLEEERNLSGESTFGKPKALSRFSPRGKLIPSFCAEIW